MHLNSGNICTTKFYLFATQMPSIILLNTDLKVQTISQTTYDLKSKLLVRYSSHDLKNKTFNEKTILDHSNTKLVRYSDPHCTPFYAKN